METPKRVAEEEGGDGSNLAMIVSEQPVNPVSDNSTAPETTPPETTPPEMVCAQYAEIDNTGKCKSCHDTDTTNGTLCCMFCTQYFHAVCRDALTGDKSGTEIICTRSFFNNFLKVTADEGVYTNRHGNFKFVCDRCLTNFETNRVASQDDKIDKVDKRVDSMDKTIPQIKTLIEKFTNPETPKNSQLQETKVDKLDKRVDDLSKNVDEIKTILVEKISNVCTSTSTNEASPVTYASTLAGSSKSLKRSVLVVEKDPSGTVARDPNAFHDLLVENSIHVDKSFVNNSGNAVFVCPTENDRKHLNEKLTEKFPSMKISQPPELLPTISVSNLARDYTVPELKEIIFKEHPEIKDFFEGGEMFDIMKIKPHRRDNSRYQASVRVGNNIRKFIELHGNKLYVGSSCCRVFDNFFVKRCNKCQKFGHYKDECSASKFTCGLCSGNHETNQCTNANNEHFVPTCTNCMKHQNNTSQHSHSASDLSCPAYIREQHKVRRAINYYNQKNFQSYN